jgi:hypothetical protein
MQRSVTTNPSGFVPGGRPALRIIRGGLEPDRSPREWLERGMRELCARCKRSTNSTAYATPAIAATAQGLRFPLRLIARIITGVLVAGGPVEFGEELGHLIITFTAQEAARLNRRPPTRGGQRSAA